MSIGVLEPSTIIEGISASITRIGGSITKVEKHNGGSSHILLFHSPYGGDGYIHIMGNSYSVYFYSTNKWENRGDELNIQQLEVTLQSLISPYFELTQLIKVIHTKQQQIIDDTGVGENQTRKTQV